MSANDNMMHERDIADAIQRSDLTGSLYERLVAATRDRIEEGGSGGWCDGFLDGAVTMAAQTLLDLFLGDVPWARADDARANVVRVATGQARLELAAATH